MYQALSRFTVLQATYLAHLQFTEAQQETSKAWLLADSIATAISWCEAVLYSPDPPFLFGGGSGNETKSRVEIEHYSVAYFDCFTVFKALLRSTSIKGRAHMCYVDLSGIDAARCAYEPHP